MTTSTNPIIAERELIEILPEEHWKRWTHLLIEHGRDTCTSQRPKCGVCVLQEICPAAEGFLEEQT